MMKIVHAAIAVALSSTSASAQDLPQQQNPWFTDAQSELQQRLLRTPNTNRAKNIILLVADGNGVGTNLATRIWQGQQNGMLGEENVLSYEAFPHLALSKTYNTNAQTPDSSGTATAMMAGIKTKAGVVGVNDTVARGDCQAAEAGKVSSIVDIVADAGKSVGIVSTARITHATPASAYAFSADRNYEDDSQLPEGCTAPDIASQLFDRLESGVIDVVLGGGRRHFLPDDVIDDENKTGRRTDGRNLIEEAATLGARYVWNDETFAALDLSAGEPILGLFESSHMKYEFDRTGEPSLAEMVMAAITVLQNDEDGFFLQVEAGRVDHANHDGNLHRTVTDGVAFHEAVAKAVELTNTEDTLIIATADHEHAIAFNGYCGRGNPITGLCYGIDNAGTTHTGVPELADDGLPYTVVGYLNGAGSVIKQEAIDETSHAIERLHAAGQEMSGVNVASADDGNMDDTWKITFAGQVAAAREELAKTETGDDAELAEGEGLWIGSRTALTQEEATDPDYIQQALIPRSSETHSGEDVAIYAQGPWAHLFDGTVEQNFIFHVMHHAATVE